VSLDRYLKSELIALSLFDDNVRSEEKDAIREAILALQGSTTDQGDACVNIVADKIPDLKLRNFVSKKSMDFFKVFQIDVDFLQSKSRSWRRSNSTEYQMAKGIVSQITVANDNSKRADAFVKYVQSNSRIKNFNSKDIVVAAINKHQEENGSVHDLFSERLN
jgi:hypothetical protein